MNLFAHKAESERRQLAPLAERMRPKTLESYLGQETLIGDKALLRKAILEDRVPSMILWGPPGSGKTTLSHIIAGATKSYFIPFSAVNGSVKQIREIVAIAQEKWTFNRQKTLLFVDEIHRFNKGQQDAFLPYVENGTLTLVGATTENPSFELNSALLSRCRVFTLQALSVAQLQAILESALRDAENGLGNEKVTCDNDTLPFLAGMASGDARSALNALELAVELTQPSKTGEKHLSVAHIKTALQRTHLRYDKNGEEHYNIISALHKSMRGSDANAALYWLGRMLEGGEDPLFITRRLMRFASEDIGLADPQALVQATSAHTACHAVGMPECNLILAQCVAYLARAKKSNALYVAYSEVQKDIQEGQLEGVPLHLRNAPTALMKELHYGKGYKYTPDYDTIEEAKQDFLPESLKGRTYLP